MAEFEIAYEEKVVSVLKRHGLVASSERGRATVAGVFSRLFEVETLAEVAEKETRLRADPVWQEALQTLTKAFNTAGSDGLIRYRFGVYVTPAGPGKVVPAGHGRGYWRTYDRVDGLADNWVRSGYQDREGNLWFGTESGVSRYDGQTFITFTTADGLVDNYVWSILQDREGNLWFGTESGVSRYDGQCWTTFTTKDGLGENRVQAILQDRDGNLWFGTYGGGVSQYDGQCWTTFTTKDGLGENRVQAILQDRDGNLWFGTEAGGVSRYDGDRWTSFTTQDGLAHNSVYSILQDREGCLWFGTHGGGVSRYDGDRWTSFTTQDGLAHNKVKSIFQDRDGNLWIGTLVGLSRYDRQAFTTFTTENGLAGNEVYSILQDQGGDLWFITGNSGLSRYDGQTITTFMTQDGLMSNGVRAILQDREGRLWFGTESGGVSRYDGPTFTNFTIEDGLTDNLVRSVFQDGEGFIWFGTWDNHVSRYDGQAWTTFTPEDGLPGYSVYAILQDRDGHLWFGTIGGGVSRYDGHRWTTFTTQDGLAHNSVYSILQDREGRLWFGTHGGGVSRYDGHRWTTFTARDGLGDNRVQAILQDREGRLWFGTHGGGVSRYDGHRWTTFTARDGLGDNRVQAILQDREGRLWFGTWGGVSRYDGKVFQTLTRQDGLPSNSVWSIFQDRNGYIWIGTTDGVMRYRPPASAPPLMFVDGVVADRRYKGEATLEISSWVRLTAFEFHGTSLKTRLEAIVYQYRLEGYDKDWKTTRERRVEYWDLPPGEYTFQVKAVDRDLVYSDPAAVRLMVVPDQRIQALTEALSGGRRSSEFVGNSEALRRVQVQLLEVARTDMIVLILGETGTGKGIAARAVHGLSKRRAEPFIQVNCGAIPEGLVESELFGHERGAFTGAVSRKIGKVELAEGGALFLDEIGDLALTAQVKLLRLLEERTFEHVGGTKTLQADLRVIAATNRDLRQMVSEGRFREDLYFRLMAFPVWMPSLRERREDIPLLAAYFMERMASHLNKEVAYLTPEAHALLKNYDWPGNVRELEHAVQRAVIVCRGPTIRVEDIVLEFRRVDSLVKEFVTLEEYERRYIQDALEKTGWIIRGPHGAAALLGLPESSLRYYMKKLCISRR